MKYKLSDIMEIISGGTPKTSKPEYWNGNIPWISVKDFNGERRYVGKTEKSITEEGLSNSSTKLLNKGDIIISARGTVGELAIIPFAMAFNQSCYGLRANKNIHPMFLYYLLLENINVLKHNVHGSVFDTITRDTFESIEIELPNWEFQRQIATTLSVLDDKIELNNKINENLEQQAQAIFKSWFVDFEPFGGVMPDDWLISNLGDVSEISAGGDKPNNSTSTPTDTNTIPIYSNGLTNEGLYGYTNQAKIQEESVTVSARGTIGFVCLRQVPYVPIVRLITLIPKKEIVSAKYLYHWLKTLHIAGTGTTQQQLTVPSFKKTEVIVPDYTIMEQFTNMVNPFYKQIFANKNENLRLSALRDTLLPKLMNGEIDVSEVRI